MERYIDANRLINFIRQSKIQDKTAVLSAIELQPSFNLDKIVRCEQCKCWNREHISCEGLARCLNGEGGIRRLDGCCGEECPMLKMDWADVRLCSGLLRQEAINIINRKDTKIAELTEEINHQQAEIENLNIVLQAMRNAANSYKIENERLLQKLQQPQSEAIKEFVERLKDMTILSTLNTIGVKMVKIDDINNLVKEMVGE